MKKIMNGFSVYRPLGLRIFIIYAIIVVFSGIMQYTSNYSEYTIGEELEKAEAALINDDLDLALLLFEEAYAQKPDDETHFMISKTNLLIESKMNFNVATEKEALNEFELAHAHYSLVQEADTLRYKEAIQNKTIIGSMLVDEHFEQASRYYEQQLYSLVIGELNQALVYNIRVKEINSQLEQANSQFYEVYMSKARSNYMKYLNDRDLFDFYLTSLTSASVFAKTVEQQEEIEALALEFKENAILMYTDKMHEALDMNEREAIKYAMMILSYDSTHQQARALIDSYN